MNTLRRARRRPRTRSFNFRTLWWLIAFEASYMVYAGWSNPAAHLAVARASYWRSHRRSWRDFTMKLLATYHRVRTLP